MKVYEVEGFCSYLFCYGLFLFLGGPQLILLSKPSHPILGGAVTVPHYFTGEVTARLCKVMSGRAVNRSPGAPQSSAKSQSLSHTAFQDESDESLLVCQYPGPEWLDLTALPGPRLDAARQFATVVGARCGACCSV